MAQDIPKVEVDNTLSIEGAAADAKAVGEKVTVTKDTTYYSVVRASTLTFDDESKE